MTKKNDNVPRSPSPTELSYSRLVQMTPFFNDGAIKNDHRPEDPVASVSISHGNFTKSSENRAQSTSSMPTKKSAAAPPRSSPPASIDIPYINQNERKSRENDHNVANVGVAVMPKLPRHPATSVQFQTPKPELVGSNSTGFSNIDSHRFNTDPPLHQNRHHPNYPNHDQLRPSQNFDNDNIDAKVMSMENRVANLALKLQTMSHQSASQHFNTNFQNNPSDDFNAMIHNTSPAPSKRMQDIYQFIETLRNMQHVVLGTTDEQQRIKKSRALNALLNMFESVVNERYEEQQQLRNGNLDQKLLLDRTQQELQRMEQSLTILQSENEQFLRICEERDGQIQHLQNELIRTEKERNHLLDENERLRRDLEAADEQYKRERQRANQADIVASESDNVRNSILANYGRLTEENLELERSIEDLKNEKLNLTRDLEYCRDEVTTLSSEVDDLKNQMEQKDLILMERDHQLDDLNMKLAHKENSLQEALSDRERIQNEIFACQRNSNSTSHQLLEMQEKLSVLQREYDSLRRQNNPIVSTQYINLQSQLRQEQQSRRHLEAMLSRTNAKETAAQDQIQRLARTNAELKTRVNEMSARLSYVHSAEGNNCTDYALKSYNSIDAPNQKHQPITQQTMEGQSLESIRLDSKHDDGLQVDDDVQCNIMDYINNTM
ncbi:hypothetical protein ACHAXS_002700 [Conticribra weissflogii]